MLLRGTCDFKAEPAGVGAEGCDETGEVDDLHSFFPEYPLEVEIPHVERTSDFAGPVVPDSRAAGAIAAVGDVDLVAVAPRSPLGDLRTLEVHPARTQVRLDERCERTSLYEGREDLHGKSEIR